VLALLGASTVRSTANANESPAGAPTEDARRAEARQHFERGLALAQTGQNWNEALAEFLTSRQLFPTRSATRNAAIASQALGRYADALDLYDLLLREFRDEMPEDTLRTLTAERQALFVHFGHLTLRSNEQGVSVVVDGRERGVIPLPEPLPLQTGAHIVHLSKEGFESQDHQVFVVAGVHKVLDVPLEPLVGARILTVEAVGGETLDVVVDAATVGKTPWQGNVSAALHSVLLRGPGRGTAPLSVDLREQRSITLSLLPIVLDAKATIEPSPGTASVYVDGQFAGIGTWIGALPSGLHRVDVIAPGYMPLRRSIELKPGSSTRLNARLLLSQTPDAKPSRFYLEANGGLILARSLRGSTDVACDCDSRSRPFGWTALARVGYRVLPHVAPELGAGYLTLGERSTRTMWASTQPGTPPFRSDDERDSVRFGGPFMFASAAARFFRRFPMTTRLTAGAALVDVSLENGGTFTGSISGDPVPVTGRLVIEEPSQWALMPFLATELRVGRALTSRLSIDLGASLAVFFPPEIIRSQRAGLLALPDDDRRAVGVLTLPDEVAMRAFLAFVPSLGLRLDL